MSIKKNRKTNNQDSVPFVSEHIIRARKEIQVPQENVIDLRARVDHSQNPEESRVNADDVLFEDPLEFDDIPVLSESKIQRFFGWIEKRKKQKKKRIVHFQTKPSVSQVPKIASPLIKVQKDIHVSKVRKPISLKSFFHFTPRKPSPKKQVAPFVPPILSSVTPKKPKLEPIKKMKQPWKFTFPSFRFILKHTVIFAIICLVVLTPMYLSIFLSNISSQKERITLISKKGLAHMKQGVFFAQNNQLQQAENEFSLAESSFQQAGDSFDAVTYGSASFLRHIPYLGTQVRSAENLIDAGQEAALAGEDITQAMEAFEKLQALGSALGIQDQDMSITSGMVLVRKALDPAIEHVQNAAAFAKEVDPSVVPIAYRSTFTSFQEKIPAFVGAIDQVNDLFNGLLTILGQDESRRYLFIFANNDELRASLGFIGGFGIIDIDHGAVRSIEVPGGGVYDSSSWLDQKLQAPQPLRLVNPHWQMQDANWWPDWPTSAQKLMWFYEHSQGPTVDGVIAITPDVVETLLAITGPIDMSQDYGIAIDQNNFRSFAQTSSEVTLHDTTTPKKFIADFAPTLLNKVFQLKKEDMLPTLLALYNSLKQRDMLVYFSDTDLETAMKDFGWAGDLRETEKDYLMLVKTNIAGGKTDGVIDDSLTHHVILSPDGTLTDTVKLTCVHNGDPADALRGVKNTSYLRFYVPEGSTLLAATGFSKIPESRFIAPDDDAQVDADYANIEGQTVIDETSGTRIQNTFGKTVFGNWLEIAPGDGKTVTIQYVLPWKMPLNARKMNDVYSLLVQKQAGSRPLSFQSIIEYPSNAVFLESYPADILHHGEQSFSLERILTEDTFYGLIFD